MADDESVEPHGKRPRLEKSETKEALAVGQKAEAKYGSGWFEVEILKISGETVAVKWDYDGSEAELQADEVREKQESEWWKDSTADSKTDWGEEKVEAKEGGKEEGEWGVDAEKGAETDAAPAADSKAEDGANEAVEPRTPPSEAAAEPNTSPGEAAAEPRTPTGEGGASEKPEGDAESTEPADAEMADPAAATEVAAKTSDNEGGAKAGARAEAKYFSTWFDVDVLEESEDRVKVKWDHDGSEAELGKDEVRSKEPDEKTDAKEEPEAKSAEAESKAGDFPADEKAEAKFGSSWFGAVPSI